MANQLSGIAIILFIAFGSLTFILLFIFAKRQITRFALKSRRGPHVPIAQDAPKHLRLEIERRLNMIEKIRCEPWLLQKSFKDQFHDPNFVPHISPTHIYRMKVVDDIKELKNLILSNYSTSQRDGEDVYQYFIRLHKDGIMPDVDVHTLHTFLLLYENARHQPDDFTYSEYRRFAQLFHHIKNNIFHFDEETAESTFIQLPNETENEDRQPQDDENRLPEDESSKPLLRSLSSSAILHMKATHETSV